MAAKSEREERKRRSSSDWDKIDEDGDSKIRPDGGSPESDSNDMGASGAFVNDDKVISTREAISRCIRDDLHKAWVADGAGGSEDRPHLSTVLEVLHTKVHKAMTAMCEREEEAKKSKGKFQRLSKKRLAI